MCTAGHVRALRTQLRSALDTRSKGIVWMPGRMRAAFKASAASYDADIFRLDPSCSGVLLGVALLFPAHSRVRVVLGG